ncbi:hypothetical protein [Bailinhaonella thermotolerans]|uniref:Uncharacterized protein n=1 Tax=Bailinhaonella thermotolerans TaxID=1070861 RepID=A0A3A4AVT0_9ACTN|nr:hypothetical protein [Bailinhaonella thermotolerans]RJL32457.1 hypothetical protein D5H75_13035 [Bailinhaonella thermotolerans]
MYEDIDEAVRRARERVRRHGDLSRRREVVSDQLATVTQRLVELEAQLASEQRDVDRLEGRSLVGMLSALTGGKEERLIRERAEADAARIKVEGERGRALQLTEDLRRINAELVTLEHARQEYDGALARKEEAVRASGDPRAAHLAEVAERLADTRGDLREYGEALAAGQQAKTAVATVLRALGRARGWSVGDMVGLGFADMAEHGHLAHADRAAWEAQRALDVFTRELADVGVAAQVLMPPVDTRWFADVFFDNVITDALRHQRIGRTARQVEEIWVWLEHTVESLRARHDELTRAAATLTREREQLLTS